MRTIFWLTGWDNIVDMIDDPAYVIEDEMEAVPIGTRIDSFLLGRYLFEERKLPAFLDAWSQYDDPASGYRPFVVRAVPSVVQTTVSRAGVCALYPWARQQCMPESIRVVSSKNEKAPAKFFGRVQNLFPDGLLTMSGLLFRGMGLYSLELMMTFFIPRISTNNKDNEFGPGIYTTTDFEYAKRYAGSNGAMMVFRDVDNRDLFVWEPKGDDWSQLIGHYTNLQQSDDHVPAKRKGADVIRGPISATREGTTRVTRGSLVPDVNTIQQAFVSYRSCERLAASLVAIIYISGS